MEKTIYCRVCGEKNCKKIGYINDKSEEFLDCFVEPKITFKVISLVRGYVGIIVENNWRINHEITYHLMKMRYVQLYGIYEAVETDNCSVQIYSYDSHADYILIAPSNLSLIPYNFGLREIQYQIGKIISEVTVDDINEFISYLTKIYSK